MNEIGFYIQKKNFDHFEKKNVEMKTSITKKTKEEVIFNIERMSRTTRTRLSNDFEELIIEKSKEVNTSYCKGF